MAVPAPGSAARTVAAFDFDGTLIRGDSLWHFLRDGLGPWRLLRALLAASPWLLLYGLRCIDNEAAKARLLYCALGGRPLAQVQAWADHFVQRVLPGLLRPEVLERLRWHQAQGHPCLLVSASVDLYLQGVGEALALSDVLCTRMEVRSGVVSGQLASPNCYGAQKVHRLQQWLAERGWPREALELYAYGDSAGDHALWAFADHAFLRDQPAPPPFNTPLRTHAPHP